MATVSDRRRWRQQILELLYEETTADGVADLPAEEIKLRLRLDDADYQEAIHYLQARDLVERLSFAGEVAITEQGIDAAEETLEPTTPAALGVTELRRVEAFLVDLRRAIDADALPEDEDDRAVVEVEADTLATALRSPRPNRGVVAAALRTIGSLMRDVAGGVVGNAAYEVLKTLA